MTTTTVRVGNGTAIHLADDAATSTFCGAEGGRGRTASTRVTRVDAPVTCRRCSPAATATAPRHALAPTPAAPAPRYDRRAFLLAAAERLEREGRHDLARQARADAAQ